MVAVEQLKVPLALCASILEPEYAAALTQVIVLLKEFVEWLLVLWNRVALMIMQLSVHVKTHY